jgi:ABC-type branched-subunit amino acid transport system ATPase component
MSCKNAIHLQSVVKRYGIRNVVDVDDVALGACGIEGLIGPNGAGKTTLINLISNKISMTKGKILFIRDNEETDISRSSLNKVSRLGLVRSNQIIQDFESLTIMDSMLLALAASRHERFYKIFNDKKVRKMAEEEIQWYLDFFHFNEPNENADSAGEKKLLDIIRCMMLRPKFLLMDEPTAGLPEDQTNRVIDLMRMKTKEDGMRILIVEHDLELIWCVCEKIHFMAEGKIMIQGTPDEIKCNEIVHKKYIGEY